MRKPRVLVLGYCAKLEYYYQTRNRFRKSPHLVVLLFNGSFFESSFLQCICNYPSLNKKLPLMAQFANSLVKGNVLAQEIYSHKKYKNNQKYVQYKKYTQEIQSRFVQNHPQDTDQTLKKRSLRLLLLSLRKIGHSHSVFTVDVCHRFTSCNIYRHSKKNQVFKLFWWVIFP